ncbi:MAG: hypothetical protein UFB05_04685 [[Eubacterium] siraeum]|nr:hypothetical protein [[Eubacterium] siraeum]
MKFGFNFDETFHVRKIVLAKNRFINTLRKDDMDNHVLKNEMNIGKKQPKWDIYEAAILLDGYLETQQKCQPRIQIIKRVSEQLRNMAINRGKVIDEVYRNENGISYQMQSMDSAYKGENVYVPATRLFKEVVELYRTDTGRYFDILEEAKRMVAAKQNNKEAFLVWAASVLPAQRCKWIEKNILKMEHFAVVFKLISGSIFDITDTAMLTTIYEAAGKNKIFQIKNRKLIKNINDDFQTYMQYCSQLSKKADQATDSDMLVIEPSAKSMSTFATLTEQEAGTTASKHSMLVNAPTSAACEAEFLAYLQNTAKLADKTCVSYVSSIRSAERYAIDNGYLSYSLFNEDKEKIIATASELYSDSDFISYNDNQHNRFSAAINKLLEFIGADIPEKAAASLGKRHDNQITAPAEANSEIVAVLKQHYEYGFKYDSIRELMRFRQFADEMGITLPEEDEALKTSILSSGTVIDDKVYCKNDDMLQELQRIVDDILSSGAVVIYYESLFENKQEWMESHVITSPDMLKEYLQYNISGCSFSKKFMVKGSRCSEKDAVTDELKRIWGAHPVESVYRLSDRLPYIPIGNIWRVISGNDLFVLSSEGEYLFIDRFRITKDEEEDILDFVDEICEENGFASLCDVPLGSIEEENYELTQTAIYNAIYKKVLSGKYHLNGKILTKEKSELDAVMLLKQYIKDKDECTFDEVADKVVELTGGINRQYAFQALYDDMVRVDKNRFVTNRLVNFSIDEIDTVLAGFITDNFRAIRDVTTFAMFPLCGQNWNHYLLESFCYKYSRKYSLHVIHFNDKNAGIIAEKDFNKKYNEMLAIALARTDVELSSEVIGQYLFNTGYMAKSKYAKLGEIAQRASELRKER